MASKQEIFDSAKVILEKHGVSSEDKLYVDLVGLLEPKKGGVATDLSEVVEFNDAGQAVRIKCSLSGVWFDANQENFYNDKNSKVIDVEGNGLSRHSKAAYAIKNDFVKTVKASKDAITADVMNEVISVAEGKEQMAALPTEPDYSTLG